MEKITEFQNKVYWLCKKVPMGKVTTYREIAEKMGTKAYRAVGNALNKNMFGILRCTGKNMVPCHRVVGSNGHLTGFAHGLKKKAELLREEGVMVKGFKIANFEKVLFKLR